MSKMILCAQFSNRFLLTLHHALKINRFKGINCDFFVFDMTIDRKIREEVLEAILKAGSDGSTITEIEKKTKFERHTLSKYLIIMAAHGLIYFKQFGKAKVWYVNKVPLQKTLDPKVRKLIEKASQGGSDDDLIDGAASPSRPQIKFQIWSNDRRPSNSTTSFHAAGLRRKKRPLARSCSTCHISPR